MKRSIHCFLVVMFNFMSAESQIILENTYNVGPNSPEFTRIRLENIGNEEYKYIYTDYNTNKIELFNLNHTPYLSITVPTLLIDEANYEIAYVTRSLFDCDSNKIEYAILPKITTGKFQVFREDGVLIFERDSVLAPYCFGCIGGAYDVRPIIRTPEGSKLFLHKSDENGNGFLSTEIYRLCGDLPTRFIQENDFESSNIEVYPNPGEGKVTLKIDLKSNIHKHQLSIVRSTG